MISNENVMFTNVYRRINQTLLGRDVILLILPLNDKRHVTCARQTSCCMSTLFLQEAPVGGVVFLSRLKIHDTHFYSVFNNY